jgi:hypothetical protein
MLSRSNYQSKTRLSSINHVTIGYSLLTWAIPRVLAALELQSLTADSRLQASAGEIDDIRITYES